MSQAAIGSVQGLIKQLYDNAEFLGELFEQREIYIDPADHKLLRRAKRMRSERIVRLNVDDQGGATAALASRVRELFIDATRRDRVQGQNINLKNTFAWVDLRRDAWQQALLSGANNEMENQENKIRDELELIEQRYSEDLDQINYTIDLNYGFGEQGLDRAREFELYLSNIETMRVKAIEYCEALNDESYQEVPFLRELALRMDTRFRRHGETIARIKHRLDHHLARARQRQTQTRRSMRFLRWLRQNPDRRVSPGTQYDSDMVSLLARPPALALSATCDTSDAIHRDIFAQVGQELLQRRKSRESLRRPAITQAASTRHDTPEREQMARDALSEQASTQWNPLPWIDDYLQMAIRLPAGDTLPATLQSRQGEPLSAIAYWRYRSEGACADESIPTERAWLSEILQMVLTDRPIGSARFFERFSIALSPPLAESAPHGTHQVADVGVAVRAGVLERYRSHG